MEVENGIYSVLSSFLSVILAVLSWKWDSLHQNAVSKVWLAQNLLGKALLWYRGWNDLHEIEEISLLLLSVVNINTKGYLFKKKKKSRKEIIFFRIADLVLNQAIHKM